MPGWAEHDLSELVRAGTRTAPRSARPARVRQTVRPRRRLAAADHADPDRGRRTRACCWSPTTSRGTTARGGCSSPTSPAPTSVSRLAPTPQARRAPVGRHDRRGPRVLARGDGRSARAAGAPGPDRVGRADQLALAARQRAAGPRDRRAGGGAGATRPARRRTWCCWRRSARWCTATPTPTTSWSPPRCSTAPVTPTTSSAITATPSRCGCDRGRPMTFRELLDPDPRHRPRRVRPPAGQPRPRGARTQSGPPARRRADDAGQLRLPRARRRRLQPRRVSRCERAELRGHITQLPLGFMVEFDADGRRRSRPST